jgi:hypothetical protein
VRESALWMRRDAGFPTFARFVRKGGFHCVIPLDILKCWGILDQPEQTRSEKLGFGRAVNAPDPGFEATEVHASVRAKDSRPRSQKRAAPFEGRFSECTCAWSRT